MNICNLTFYSLTGTKYLAPVEWLYTEAEFLEIRSHFLQISFLGKNHLSTYK